MGFVISCKDNESEPNIMPPFERVSIENDDLLGNTISELNRGSGKTFSSNNSQQEFYRQIDFNNVVKITDTELNRTTYSAIVTKTRSGRTLENYILMVQGDKKLEAIVRYQSNTDDWFLYNTIEENLNEFSGTLYIENLDGLVMAKSKFKDGVSYIPNMGSASCDTWSIVEYENAHTFVDSDGYLTTVFYSWTVSEWIACETEVEEIEIFAPAGDNTGAGSPNPPSVPTNNQDVNKPCPGNPLSDITIAGQSGSGINGGRYGMTRKNGDGTSKLHDGIDIKVDQGSPIYAAFGGTAYQGFQKYLGNFIAIVSTVNGRKILTVYGHLQDDMIQDGSKIATGTVIGFAGRSGNLGEAIDKGLTESHLHFKVRDSNDPINANKWNHKNPEDYLNIVIDPNTGENLITDCNEEVQSN